MHSEYALSLALEAVLLLIFGLLGANLKALVALFVPTTVLLLCYIMGLQNAVVTKISRAEIRTTHVTGIATDLGIELGKLLYWNRHFDKKSDQYVAADHDRLMIHGAILGMFFVGGVAGAYGFKAIGFSITVPLALLLLFFAIIPILDDISLLSSSYQRQHRE